MSGVISWTGLSVKISQEEVFRDLDCTPQCAAYETFAQEYRNLRELVDAYCCPAVYLKECRFPEGIVCGSLKPGDRILCGLYTVGRRVSNWSTDAFLQEDYVKGMLINAMADAALFSMEKQIERILLDYCQKRGVGIAGRYYAADRSSMPLQRFLYEELEGKRNGFLLSDGYMFDPVKTNTMVFGLTQDSDVFCVHHTCSGCAGTSCKRRQTAIF